uniref:Uncharacterized protein n=1 Tax=Klebsiella pneumoniae TaxID=573 RepID=A0A6G9HKP5_KLEPN|nr:hypothetical protein [Klebsiella pneumoniae]
MLAQGAPRRRTVRLPFTQQTGKRRAAVALFLPQFTSFAAGQKIGRPALGRSDIALFARAVQAVEQRQVMGKKALPSSGVTASARWPRRPPPSRLPQPTPAHWHQLYPPTGKLLLTSCITRKSCFG